MTVKTTKTTNKLHFTDLDPIRFEDFCLALIYPLHPWADIRHYVVWEMMEVLIYLRRKEWKMA